MELSLNSYGVCGANECIGPGGDLGMEVVKFKVPSSVDTCDFG